MEVDWSEYMDSRIDYENEASQGNVDLLKKVYSHGTGRAKVLAIQKAICLKITPFDQEARAHWEDENSPRQIRLWSFTYLCYKELATKDDWERCFDSGDATFIAHALDNIGQLNLQELRHYALRFKDSSSEKIADSASRCIDALDYPVGISIFYNH
ncbi:MAG: hypothetical protein CL932_00305 [Deltaproteobacteria bacterium]|nr:hypothetical protein [Deltaproteobacteria bacterium]|tara:strand:+ start:893 stop:1360 length:468 start_codon:yes stop_codon:yes gene_type:complete